MNTAVSTAPSTAPSTDLARARYGGGGGEGDGKVNIASLVHPNLVSPHRRFATATDATGATRR